MSQITFFLYVLVISYATKTATQNLPQLKMLSVVKYNILKSLIYDYIVTCLQLFRHGDRVPDDEVSGDLTMAGRQKAYHLGAALRARYADFLGDIYEASAVSSRSTEYSRAKMSLQLLLAALYVPRKHQIWHESLAWQPLPFSYAPKNDDVLLFPKFCPRFEREQQKIRNWQAFWKLSDPYMDMMKNSTSLTGQTFTTTEDLWLLYNKLSAMRQMNKTVPTWAADYFPNGLLLNATFTEYEALKFTDWMRKINGGALMRKITDDMLSKAEEESTNRRKLFLYGAHEFNIVSLLQTLKLWQPHIPEYSSAVIIELREDHKNYYVKVVYYKGIDSAGFKEMQITGCPSFCPLARFIELISDQLPSYDEIICDYRPVNLNETMPF